MTESQADAAPLTDPGPPPAPPTSLPRGWDRFFGWVRGVGITRTDGWIGGVCAGIAARIGIDPVIVRGVFVVAALFGLPMFLVYAVGWALLPDLAGRIHLQELTRRRFDPAMVGIGLMVLVGFFPVVPWFFAGILPFGYLVPGTWFDWSPLWTLFSTAVLAGVIFLIARSASRRASSTGASPVPDPRTAYAAPENSGSPAFDLSGVGAPTDPAAAPSAPAGFVPPPAPHAPGADDAEVAEWRRQHDAWKMQDDAWRRQQQDAERAAREQARAERAAAGAAFAAEAAERRRIHRLSMPRTSGAFIAVVTGAALVAGSLTALLVGGEDGVLAVAIGLFAAALVVAVSMIVAGSIKRRSGFLAFVTVALLFAGAVTSFVPLTRGIVFGATWVNNYSPQSFIQLGGSLSIDVSDVGGSPDPIDIEMRSSDTSINIGSNVLLDLQVVGPDEVPWVMLGDRGQVVEEGTWDATGGSVTERIDTRERGVPGTRQIVRLQQTNGTPYVTIYDTPED